MCLTPMTLKTNDIVPCGKCPDCKGRRVSAWSFRLMMEYKRCTSAVFLTLTYDSNSVPITPKGYMTIKKKDIQNFMKRLRKENEQGIKYYACGEYGGKTKRPHYHIILFNAKVETIMQAWTLDGVALGTIHYGTVNEASVGYTLKYISKPKQIPQHKNDDRQKEFALMSKKLGDNYLNDAFIQWHKADAGRTYCNLKDGKKISMPRYYKEKIYTPAERAREAELLQAKKQALLQNQTFPMDYHRQWLNHKEAVKAAQENALFNNIKNDKL